MDSVYNEFANEYDQWFLANENLLTSEVKMVAAAIGTHPGRTLSIGCGSGLMEAIMKRDFGIVVTDGIEPAHGMAEIARSRGMTVSEQKAEDFKLDDKFDTILFNGCPSYIADLESAFKNAKAHLNPGGRIIVCDVPKESAYASVYNLALVLGTWDHKLLDGVKPPHPYPIEFVKSALWRTRDEIMTPLKAAGMTKFEYLQTLTMNPNVSNDWVEEPKRDWTSGSYVAVVAS